MPYNHHLTLSEIAEETKASPDKLRTIIAREGIQPIRFPHDMRRLYYKPEDIQRIKDILNLKQQE